uniref:Transmembrane protein n=1 Tax=Mesocestoides corti TaxID=53468 RepID=A0A5K3FXX7_MESCO
MLRGAPRQPTDLQRSRSRAAFFRVLLPLQRFHFAPALPAPILRVAPANCSVAAGNVGLIIFSLPWNHQVYHYRFNPMESKSFVLQTTSSPPLIGENFTSPFVDIIIDPRCDNRQVSFSYSFPQWLFQVFRVHVFHCASLVAGHLLLSVHVLLVSRGVRVRWVRSASSSPAVVKRRRNSPTQSPPPPVAANGHAPPHRARPNNGRPPTERPCSPSGRRLAAEWAHLKYLVGTVGCHCLVALSLCLLH